MMIGSMVGNYKIVRKIGEGGMGSVFQGIDIMLEREVAIKMLRPEFASQPNVVERFRTEAVTLARLSHPNIATLHSFFRQRDDFFMVMEFVRGETLDDIIRSRGAMTLGLALPLFCQSLEGIGYAHRMGIIHRDIKPANMMLTPEGSIKVMDFGIARVLGTARMTRQGAIVGTIEYMSPEQVRGEEGDARSDVYSLGILLYEMLTGRLPFSSTSEFELMRAQTDDAPTPPRTFVAEIPLPIEQAIMRSLAKRAEARFQTAGEFREVMVNALGGNLAPIPGSGAIGAAPSVRQSTASPVASTPLAVVKETRLGGQFLTPAHIAQRDATRDWLSESELKETRLGFRGDLQLDDAAVKEDPARVQRGATETRASLLERLNWKHYGAACVVAILLGVSIAMFASAMKEPPSVMQAPTEAAPSPPPPRQQEPAAENPVPVEPLSEPDAGFEPYANNPKPRSGGNSPPRRDSSRGDGRTYSSPEPVSQAPSVAPTPTAAAPIPGSVAAPPSEAQQPPKQEDQPAVAPTSENKRDKNGFLKDVKKLGDKIFGRGKNKNKDKDKDKKP